MPSEAIPWAGTASRSWPSYVTRARRRLVDPADDVEHRRLAGPVGTDQPADVTGLDAERQAVEGDDAAEANRHLLHVDQRHSARPHVCDRHRRIIVVGPIPEATVAVEPSPLADFRGDGPTDRRRRSAIIDDDDDADDEIVLPWWQRPSNIVIVLVARRLDRRDDRLADRRLDERRGVVRGRRRLPPGHERAPPPGGRHELLVPRPTRHRPSAADRRPLDHLRAERRDRTDAAAAQRDGRPGGGRGRPGDGLDGPRHGLVGDARDGRRRTISTVSPAPRVRRPTSCSSS